MSTLNDEDRENLAAFLDGELDEETAHTLEAKINLDPKARAEVDALRQAWGLLDYLPKPAPSTSFTHKTMEKLSLERLAAATGKVNIRRPLSWATRMGWAAALLVAAGAGYGLSFLLHSAPKVQPEVEEALVQHLRVIDKLHQYQNVDDVEFLKALDHPDLFGEEPGS